MNHVIADIVEEDRASEMIDIEKRQIICQNQDSGCSVWLPQTTNFPLDTRYS